MPKDPEDYSIMYIRTHIYVYMCINTNIAYICTYMYVYVYVQIIHLYTYRLRKVAIVACALFFGCQRSSLHGTLAASRSKQTLFGIVVGIIIVDLRQTACRAWEKLK